jgi:hypothetical protein
MSMSQTNLSYPVGHRNNTSFREARASSLTKLPQSLEDIQSDDKFCLKLEDFLTQGLSNVGLVRSRLQRAMRRRGVYVCVCSITDKKIIYIFV